MGFSLPLLHNLPHPFRDGNSHYRQRVWVDGAGQPIFTPKDASKADALK
jgi:hypothetical protein